MYEPKEWVTDCARSRTNSAGIRKCLYMACKPLERSGLSGSWKSRGANLRGYSVVRMYKLREYDHITLPLGFFCVSPVVF